MTSLGLGRAHPRAVAAPRRRPRRRRWPRPRTVVTYGLALGFCAIWFFPVYWMLNTAFKPSDEVSRLTPEFLPRHPTLTNFSSAVHHAGFLRDALNSVIVVSGTVLLSIALGVFAAAALARFHFRGRRLILVTIIVVQMLPSTALLIPMFVVFNKLGLLGSYWGLMLAYVAGVLPFSIWVMRGFFLAIPKEIEEAAVIDGANTRQILFRVLFPLVTPGIISTSIFAFVFAWNDYIFAYTFMKVPSMYTLPVWLDSFVTQNAATDYGSLMAASVVFSLPVVIFFLAIQRNLVSGMSAGAVKG